MFCIVNAIESAWAKPLGHQNSLHRLQITKVKTVRNLFSPNMTSEIVFENLHFNVYCFNVEFLCKMYNFQRIYDHF